MCLPRNSDPLLWESPLPSQVYLWFGFLTPNTHTHTHTHTLTLLYLLLSLVVFADAAPPAPPQPTPLLGGGSQRSLNSRRPHRRPPQHELRVQARQEARQLQLRPLWPPQEGPLLPHHRHHPHRLLRRHPRSVLPLRHPPAAVASALLPPSPRVVVRRRRQLRRQRFLLAGARGGRLWCSDGRAGAGSGLRWPAG